MISAFLLCMGFCEELEESSPLSPPLVFLFFLFSYGFFSQLLSFNER